MEKSVENIDGFEYSFLGIRINVFSNSDKNIKEMKKQVPYLSDKIYIGQKSVLLDTTAPSDEGHIDRLGVLLKETNDNK